MKKCYNLILSTLLVCATLLFGTFFTAIRTNAIGSESFEAGPQEVEFVSLDSFEDLVLE